jgi:signal-transduction protein with cAMP-binding, CBS, and nucleotidyltransferase domain
MQSQTKIFSRLVRDYMRTSPVVLSGDATVGDLVARMTAAKTTSALITDPTGRLSGIITEQDVLRRIALRCQGEEPIGDVMTTPAQAIRVDDYLYYAIARMRRFGWRHMPVIDGAERPVGMIDLRDALAVAGEEVLRDIELISHEDSLDGLREIKAAQVDLVANLFADNVPGTEIQALLSHINRDIHRRIIETGLAAMAEAGWGAPPVDFALIIMGSGGRGENFLYPDQDNGFILDDYPDSDHDRIDGFFIELAERMTRQLDTVGFPFCKGYVMATNPLWRKTRSQWRDQIRLWGRRRSVIAIQLSDIFFDFQAGYGRLGLGGELRRHVSEMVRASPAFMSELYREIADRPVALGWFGRFVTEKDNPLHRGKINLKHAGTLPLVQNVRLLCLREGVEETATLARIDALEQRGKLDRDEADYLSGAFRHITNLLLRQQITDFKDGQTVGNFVHPDALSERERDMLVDAFEAIEDLRKKVKSEFTADIF